MEHETKIRKTNDRKLMSANRYILEKFQSVLVGEPREDDMHQHEFAGTVVGFRNNHVVVEDQEENTFEVDADNVQVLGDNHGEAPLPIPFTRTNREQVKDKNGRVIDLFDEVLGPDGHKRLVVGFIHDVVIAERVKYEGDEFQASELEVVDAEGRGGRFVVFNETDGFFADPDDMSFEEAREFVKGFHKRFKHQNYMYRCADRELIPAEQVRLDLRPFVMDMND